MGLIHVTKKHTGKMEGMQSISTSVRQNPYCQCRIKKGDTVCSKCYAETIMKMRPNVDSCMNKNGELLSSKVIDPDYLPKLNVLYFRFEAFGDLINATHVINYFNICKKNPETNFALWTKNPGLIDQAIKSGETKPDNLQIVYSSPKLDEIDEPKYDFIDKVFTVFHKDSDVEINCGKKKCMECKLCYKKNDVKYINERLK